MGGCGTCEGTCNCALASGSNTTVSGTGVVGDPYVIEATLVVEATATAGLSGNGTAASPLRASVAVSGQDGNAISVRSVDDGNPGLYASVPVKSIAGPDGVAYSPDGTGRVDISAASLRAGLEGTFEWLTLDEPNQRFNFTPANGSGYVWATVGGVVGWYDLDTILDTLALASGESTFDRTIGLASESQLSLSTVHFTVFTAKRSEDVSSVTVWSGSTATSTPTNLWIGVYSVGGTWTQVATSADVAASALIATNTSYQVAMAAPFEKVAGTKYAVAILQVGGTAAKVAGPLVRSYTDASYKGHFYDDGPVQFATKTATTALPASVDPSADLGVTGNLVPLYAWLRP